MRKEKTFHVDWDGPSIVIVTEVDMQGGFVTIQRVNGEKDDADILTITAMDFIQMILE